MSSVFLCHSSVDKPFARRLARDLVEHGVRVWLDEAELLVGDSLLAKIALAIDQTEFVAALLSPNSVHSSWVQKELDLAMSGQLQSRQIKVLPIVLAECEVPGLLKDTLCLRMDTPDRYATGLENLLRRLGAGSPAVTSGTVPGENPPEPPNRDAGESLLPLRIRISTPADGEEISLLAHEIMPAQRPVRGDIIGLAGEEIDALQLRVDVSILTDRWYPQGIAKVRSDGSWGLQTVYFGGAVHHLRATLKDRDGNERATATHVVTLIQ